jgi:hypothetical protein
MSFPMTGVPPVISGAENAKTTAWVGAVVTAGGTVSAGRRTLIDNLFNSMDADSLAPARLWLHAAENAPSALVDLFGLASATAVNSPTFTADQGYAGNGTSSYLNLGSSNAGTQNSSAFGVYLRADIGGQDGTDIGSSSAGTAYTSNLVSEWSDSNMYAALNDGNGDGGRAEPADTKGIWVLSRTASGSFVVYKGGSSFATVTQTSSGVPNRNYCTGASFDTSGTATLFTTRQYGMSVLVGAGWTGTQVANFTTHVQTYLTAVGA